MVSSNTTTVRKQYKGRLVYRGKYAFVRLYGPRRKYVDVMVSAPTVTEYSDTIITTDHAQTQRKLDLALSMYAGPTGIWEEERRLR